MPRRKNKIKGQTHPIEWYYDRIGKRIKRISGSFGGRNVIDDAAKTTGLIVHNKDFAEYLHILQEEQKFRYDDMDVEVLNSKIIKI